MAWRMRVEGEGALSAALAQHPKVFPSLISMIAVGEKSGMVTEQLDKVAEYYEREVDRGLKRLLSLVEPILLIIFGAMAAVVILSTFMPMYQSMSMAKCCS